MAAPITVKGPIDFEIKVLKSEIPVLVDFWAEWCGPCKMMEPGLEQIAQEYEGKLKIAKVDTDEVDNQNLNIQYQIFSIPNLKLFKNGQLIKEFIGYRPKDMFEMELKEFIKKD